MESKVAVLVVVVVVIVLGGSMVFVVGIVVVVADFGLRPGFPLGVLGNLSGGRGYFRGRPRPRLGGTAGVLGVAS